MSIVAFLIAVGYGGRPPGSTRFSRGEVAALIVYAALVIAFVADVLSG